jgi:hypothetical protein
MLLSNSLTTAMTTRCFLARQFGLLWLFLFLHAFVPPASSVDALSPTNTMKPTKKALTTSIAIGRALQQSSNNAPLSFKLNLQTDFYDPKTGLYSEGVWHNTLMGIASIEQTNANGQPIDPSTLQLADSLYAHSWDGVSFRRRTWSGNWDHSSLLDHSSNPPEQANYYRESSEHRCVQHGMALVFWSKLVQANTRTPAANNNVKQHAKLQKQQDEIAHAFLKEFWDSKEQRWNTVSQTQGGGTQGRPSASAGNPPHKLERHTTKQLLGSRIIVPWIKQWPYWRFVNT